MNNKSFQKKEILGNQQLIAFGIAPRAIIAIGIVPMGLVSLGCVSMGLITIGVVGMGILDLSLVGCGLVVYGIRVMGLLWKFNWKIIAANPMVQIVWS